EGPDSTPGSSRLVDRPDVIRSPWLRWMCNALRGQSIDVAHFICHGHLSRDRGAMLFAESPLSRSQAYLSSPVGAVELGAFLTQVGAWSTVFSSVPDNNSEAGLLALADEIAQSRPGPMMMHLISQDLLACEQGYRFLYGDGPRWAPMSSALFIYCQPYLLSEE